MLIRQAKISYLKSSLSRAKASPQTAAQMWYRIDSIIDRRQPALEVPIDDSMSLDSIKEFFESVAATDDHNDAACFPSLEVLKMMTDYISVDDVFWYLSSLDVTKSTGLDGLLLAIFKRLLLKLLRPYFALQ